MPSVEYYRQYRREWKRRRRADPVLNARINEQRRRYYEANREEICHQRRCRTAGVKISLDDSRGMLD